MNKYKLIVFSLLLVLLTNGCSKQESISPANEKSGLAIPENSNPRGFIWQALNIYYYWQNNVSLLADGKFKNSEDLYNFANKYESPKKFFEALKYEKDRFSWIVDDYRKLERSFQGIRKSFGYSFGLGTTQDDRVFGFVKYVVPNSPADKAGIKRGDLFTKIDDTQLTANNYKDLLFSKTTYKVGFAKIEKVDGKNKLTSIDKSASVSAVELKQNPILVEKTIKKNNIKIGYLCYNQFISNNNAHSELNNVFGKFKASGVTEMVLDLRYNSGGSILTCSLLASMLYPESSKDKEFGKIVYNNKIKKNDKRDSFKFYDQMPNISNGKIELTGSLINKINIKRLFVLTSGNTASASELIIAGLRAYMPVTIIGTKTVGKNVGSITLYDSPNDDFLGKKNINPNHTYAMQPIVSQIANSKGFTDYTEGFQPNVESNEVKSLGNMKPLGDSDEQLFAEAIEIIAGQSAVARQDLSTSDFVTKTIYHSESEQNSTILLDILK